MGLFYASVRRVSLTVRSCLKCSVSCDGILVGGPVLPFAYPFQTIKSLLDSDLNLSARASGVESLRSSSARVRSVWQKASS